VTLAVLYWARVAFFLLIIVSLQINHAIPPITSDKQTL
jgi:hypothetical protein